MARRGDGLVLRGKTWWLDFTRPPTSGQTRREHQQDSGWRTGCSRAAKALKQEAGIGGRKRRDISFDKAADEFLQWAEANHRPQTVINYRWYIQGLKQSFAGKLLSQIHPFNVEKHKQTRIAEDARVSANREISVLRNLFYRCMEWGKFDARILLSNRKGLKPAA